MASLGWILGGGLLRSLVALGGAFTLLLPMPASERTSLALVALAAGSLPGSAFLRMIPHAAVEISSVSGALSILEGSL